MIPARPKSICPILPTALHGTRSRRGVAALIALVCLSLATVVGTLLLQAALSEQRYLSRLEVESQCEWLVEAGFSRAAAQLAKSPRYSGETWTIPAASVGHAENAIVKIAVRADAADPSQRQIAVTATFAGANHPAIEGSRKFVTR